VKTPFDFVLGYRGIATFFDAKSIGDKNFVYSQITQHQVHELLVMELAGFRAGYVVHFRNAGLIRFFNASDLARLLPGDSLGPDEGESLGTTTRFNLDLFKNR
jgi:penicillin-binding protein-related factor A (putative recombinase)